MKKWLWILAIVTGTHSALAQPADSLRLGVFDIDVSPPVGSPLAYDPCDGVAMSLRASGIVLIGKDAPIVLCSVDWIGIANEGHRMWRLAIAEAVGTTADRFSVHAVHQHDAPFCDFSAEALLATRGLSGTLFDVPFAQQTITRVADAARQATEKSVPVTHIGLGQAPVEQVASNRRILGEDGKVRATRYTACADPALRAEPEGTIDKLLKTVSFWHDDQPLVVMTFYATHPQSYYRRGIANPDFPGMARFLRQVTLNGLLHVHFTGAGGNIGAGKYNDGSAENRQVLAERLAHGMAAAWVATERQPILAADVAWKSQEVDLPPAPHLNEQDLVAILDDETRTSTERGSAATDLAWLLRCQHYDGIQVSCLHLGNTRILLLPGEAVVEYQLWAQQENPDRFVAVAAYGDYASGYICLKEHYAQGGYEASPGASRVAPESEAVLKEAIREILH
jgi:hypothetical protein